jgi:hypothetical protein
MIQDRYPGNIYYLKKKGLDRNHTTNIGETRLNPPNGYSIELWGRFVDYWEGEDFIRRSGKAKQNRALHPELSVHTGGSRTFAATKKALVLYLLILFLTIINV